MRKQVAVAAFSLLAAATPAGAVAAQPLGGPGARPQADHGPTHADSGHGHGHGHGHAEHGHVHPDSAGAADHAHQDLVHHDVQSEARLRTNTEVRTAAAASVASAASAGAASEVGEWGPLTPWPVVGIHTALLPDGRVLSYDSVADTAAESQSVHDFTRATVWDPVTGQHTRVDLAPGTFNVFCSGLAHLADGRVFLAGGNKDASLAGIRQTHVFSPPGTWTRTADMAYERWYPSVTPLPDGQMLITEGGPDVPEVRSTTGAIRTLPGASRNLPLYPWLDVAPDGRVFYSGPDNQMLAMTPSGQGAWQYLGAGDGNRRYGSRAVYDIGKVLVAGGGFSRRDAAVIDFSGSTPRRSVTAEMANGRRQHNLTVLADGTVLATGGNSSGAPLVDLDHGVYAAERWDPATGQWTTLAAQRQTRQYHSTATLLPDGRVLSAGGGLCGACDDAGYLAKDAEVYSPPYLFDASGAPARRPTITSAPASVATGGSFTVATPDAAAVRKVALVRLGASTHSTEMEQRYVPLSFTAGSGSLTVTAPALSTIAPPGPYMLFVLDGNGVPSVASMVSVTGAAATNTAPTVTVTSPKAGAVFWRPAAVALRAWATDRDGRVTRVEFFTGGGTVKLGEDTTAPYTWSWRNPPAGIHQIVARATDDRGAVRTSRAVKITVRR